MSSTSFDKSSVQCRSGSGDLCGLRDWLAQLRDGGGDGQVIGGGVEDGEGVSTGLEVESGTCSFIPDSQGSDFR